MTVKCNPGIEGLLIVIQLRFQIFSRSNIPFQA